MRHGYFPRIALMFQCEGEYPRQFSFDFQLKIISRLCSDAELIRNMWDHYDAQECRLQSIYLSHHRSQTTCHEKPALLGVSGEMGVGAQAESSFSSSASEPTSAAAYGLEMA